MLLLKCIWSQILKDFYELQNNKPDCPQSGARTIADFGNVKDKSNPSNINFFEALQVSKWKYNYFLLLKKVEMNMA